MAVIIQDNWSGVSDVDNTTPQVGPANWAVDEGGMNRNQGRLDVDPAETGISVVTLDSGATTGFFSMNVLHGGASGGGGHMGFAIRHKPSDNSLVACYIAVDSGAAIATWDGVSTFDVLASAGTIAQEVEYTLELEVSGNDYSFHVVGSGIDETVTANTSFNSAEEYMGVRVWGGDDTQTYPINFCEYVMSDSYLAAAACEFIPLASRRFISIT